MIDLTADDGVVVVDRRYLIFELYVERERNALAAKIYE